MLIDLSMNLTLPEIEKWEMFCEISGRFISDGMSVSGADRATFNLLYNKGCNIRELHNIRRRVENWRERKGR